MKYQAIKHLKTTSKVLGYMDTIEEAHALILKKGARFDGISYIGGFPTFRDDRGKVYSIQGFVPIGLGDGVVCSLPQKEVEAIQAKS